MHDTHAYNIILIVLCLRVCVCVSGVLFSRYAIHNEYFTVLRVYGNRWKNAAGGRVRVLSPKTKSRSPAVACKFALGNGTDSPDKN